MAKKKRKKTATLNRVEYKRENGMDVAVHENSRGPDHLWMDGADGRLTDQARQEDLVLQEVLIATKGRSTRTVKRAKRMDALERIHAHGLIDSREYDAGYKFQQDFHLGHLSGYPSPKFEFSPAVTGDRDGMIATEAARMRIHKAIEYLGGADSAMAKAVWDFVGLRLSITLHGEGARSRARWSDILVNAVKRLADFYYPSKKC